MTMSECSIKVRYSETGKMGFAHHSHYYDWFDTALLKLLYDLGIEYSKIEQAGLKVIPVFNSCNYLSPAYYNDNLTIRIFADEIKGIKLSFNYEVVRESDAVIIAKGSSSHILVDEKLRPVIIKRALPELISKL